MSKHTRHERGESPANQDGPPLGGEAARFGRLLQRELRRARAAYWREALPVAAAATGLGICLLLLILRLASPSSVTGGGVFSTLFWLLLLTPALLALLWPLRRLPGARAFLREAEQRAETRQLLETAADVADGRLAGKGYSPAIMAHLLERAVAEAASGLPTPEPAVWRRRLRPAALILPLLALGVSLLSTGTGIRPLALLLDPLAPEHYAERARLLLLPGDVEVLAGSSLRLELREENLPWRFSGDLLLELDETGDLFRPALLRRDGEVWVHELDAVYQGFSYRAGRGRVATEVFQVSVFHEPLLDSLRILALPPAYTGLPERLVDLRSGELSVPFGSRLELSGSCSNTLAEAWLLVESGDSLALRVDGRSLSISLTADQDERYRISLEDRRGIRSVTPPLLSLRVLPDQAPRVEILAPGPEEDLNRDLMVTLDVSATDDYGVADLRILAWKAGESDTLIMPLLLDGVATRVAVKEFWDLGVFQLFPGDVVEYLAEARDLRPGGPGVGRSSVQRLRVPSIAEIYAEIEAEDERRGDELSEMIEQGREMQEDLRRLEQELRADPELDWEKEQELQEALRRQEEMAQKLEELGESLSERSEALSENELLSEEMAAKLKQIEELMEELAETEAGELLRRFQEMIDEMDPESLPDELQDLRMDQEEILEQLERTAAMLEQMMREQKMEALLTQVDEMLERQEQLREETEARQDEDESAEDAEGEEAGDEESESGEDSESDSGEEDLAERQEQLAEEAEKLAEKIKEMAEELSEEFPEEAEELSDSAEPESEENPSQPMRDAAEEMKEQSPQAGESQKEASARLIKLYWRIVQSMANMQSNMDMEAMEALGEVTRQALELSLREENHHAAMERLFRAGANPDRNRQAAREQMNLYLAMDRVRERLLEAAKKTMAVSPGAMRKSRAALESMQTSVAELEAGRSVWGLNSAGLAVGHINETVIELLEGIQSSGGGSGSCNSPSQQMQKMLQQQEQLNKDSRSQGQKNGQGGLSMKQRAQMNRLKAEQRAIREGVEEINGEDGVLGSLDQVIEDMKEVEKDFEEGRINEETLRRQEKIFERLLDAQRSVHRRDFKRKRQSESADELAPLWPAPEDSDDPLARLRDEIRRGLEDAAPPEYEELIQEYYRSLLEAEEELP